MLFVNMEPNPLHIGIGKALSEYLGSRENVILLRDAACGGNQRERQHIPLFCNENRSRETEYCNVDLMVLKDNKIKVIIEIEESNVKPTQVCGKFLTSALSKHYLHHSGQAKMDKSVTFIQILDTSALVNGRTSKISQWDYLAKSINEILPLRSHNSIKNYVLLACSLNDFEQKKPELFSALDDALK